jgi:hypothetical protein
MVVISKTTMAQAQSTWTVQDWIELKIVSTSAPRAGSSQAGSPQERTQGRAGMPNIEIHAGFDGAAFWTLHSCHDRSGAPPAMRGGNGTANAGRVSLPNGEFKQSIKDFGLAPNDPARRQVVDVKVTLVDQGGSNLPTSVPTPRSTCLPIRRAP